jgi:phenylalanyl-tRNA synthetase beta chain
MRVPLSWLREFVTVDLDAQALSDKLAMGGLEVDALERMGADIAGVVVGEIVGMRPHPNADQLQVCEVRSGDGPAATLVCGARNMRGGDRVAYAPPGIELPGGRRIETAEIRGVTSAGMLCSEAELGLAETSEGILLLSRDAKVGERVARHLGIEDSVLEISVTPNRGDCLSILGVARELAALAGLRVQRPRIRVVEAGAGAEAAVGVRIEDSQACRRYAARLVRDVRIGPSPAAVQRRLRSVGLRPINNVVDVTNLVMIERGQPLHAFDFERLARPEIVVRRAGKTEVIQTLDGVVRSLVPEDLLISTGDEPIALAGIMGGAESEVTDTTRHILLEAAWFDPSCVRRTTRRLDLHSEAAYRFERGVDVEGVALALDRAAELLRQTAGGEVATGQIDQYPGRMTPVAISVRPKRVEQLLGCSITRQEIGRTMKALGASVSSQSGGRLSVVPPSFRSDLQREIDVVEEVARVIGYDRIPTKMPATDLAGAVAPERMRLEGQLRGLLRAAGLFEMVGVSFASERGNEMFPGIGTSGSAVDLANPISRDEPQLRRSLLSTLVSLWRYNRNQGAAVIAGFSIGKVYWRETAPCEGWRLAGVLAGMAPRLGLGENRPPEFADAKGVVESLLAHLDLADRVVWERGAELQAFHPGKTARLLLDGEILGVCGALHPETEVEADVEGQHWLFEIDLEKLVPHSPPQRIFHGLPRYPAVARDLAIVVDEDFAADEVIRYVRQWNRDLVEEISLFDQYVGEPIASGKKSLAYSISYRAGNRTLTDEEVNALQEQLTKALTAELNVEPR